MSPAVLIIYTGLDFDKILGQAPKDLRPNDEMSRTNLQVHIYLIPNATHLLPIFGQYFNR